MSAEAAVRAKRDALTRARFQNPRMMYEALEEGEEIDDLERKGQDDDLIVAGAIRRGRNVSDVRKRNKELHDILAMLLSRKNTSSATKLRIAKLKERGAVLDAALESAEDVKYAAPSPPKPKPKTKSAPLPPSSQKPMSKPKPKQQDAKNIPRKKQAPKLSLGEASLFPYKRVRTFVQIVVNDLDYDFPKGVKITRGFVVALNQRFYEWIDSVLSFLSLVRDEEGSTKTISKQEIEVAVEAQNPGLTKNLGKRVYTLEKRAQATIKPKPKNAATLFVVRTSVREAMKEFLNDQRIQKDAVDFLRNALFLRAFEVLTTVAKQLHKKERVIFKTCPPFVSSSKRKPSKSKAATDTMNPWLDDDGEDIEEVFEFVDEEKGDEEASDEEEWSQKEHDEEEDEGDDDDNDSDSQHELDENENNFAADHKNMETVVDDFDEEDDSDSENEGDEMSDSEDDLGAEDDTMRYKFETMEV